MKSQSELNNFKKYYRWFLAGFIFSLIACLVLLYVNSGYITYEFVIASMFTAFLGSIIYLGSFIIHLQKQIEELKENGLTQSKKK